MVTQPTEQSQQGLEEDSAALDEFKVVDSTPPDQLEVEEELDRELDQPEVAQTAEVDGEEVPLGSDTERQAQPESEAQAPEEPVAQVPEVEAPQAPQPRQYSQDEVSKMQSAWMKQVQEAQESARRATEARDLEAEVELRLRQQEETLVAQNYDQAEARRLVRNTQNEREIRGQVELRQENRRLQEQVKQREEVEEQQAKTIYARQLMDTHGLQTDDYSLLLNTATPDGMESLAKRLTQQTLTQRREEQKRRSQVPPETPETALETGRSSGAAPETYEQKLSRIRTKPSYEWTDDEYDFMRR